MRKKNYKGRVKRYLSAKVRMYADCTAKIQKKYLRMLEENNEIQEITL